MSVPFEIPDWLMPADDPLPPDTSIVDPAPNGLKQATLGLGVRQRLIQNAAVLEHNNDEQLAGLAEAHASAAQELPA